MDLAGHGMGLTELVAPVAATDGDDRQLGQDDGTADGGGDFLGALDAKADVAVLVTDGDNGLKAGTLTGTGLLLDGLDLEHFVLQGRANEVVNDLELLDGQGKGVDLLQLVDLALLDETTELGDGLPLLTLGLTTTATLTTASTATSAATAAESFFTRGWCCVRHFEQIKSKKGP